MGAFSLIVVINLLNSEMSTGGVGGGTGNDDSSDEEGQAFYVGGSEHSGQQVVGPSRGKKPAKLIQDMFESAKAHGAETVAGASGSSGERPPTQTFRGTGYKLGETADDSEVIKDPRGAVGSGPKTVALVLKLWKNGFSVQGDGIEEELRSYSDPNNAKLLNAITKGRVPCLGQGRSSAHGHGRPQRTGLRTSKKEGESFLRSRPVARKPNSSSYHFKCCCGCLLIKCCSQSGY